MAHKEKKRTLAKRIWISVLAGMAAAVLTGSGGDPFPYLTGWWGVLYPRYCSGQVEKEEEFSKNPPKISFWLAKALDW